MKEKQFVILVITTLVVVVMMFMAVSRRESAVKSTIEGQLFYPELQDKINEIAAVEISKGDARISLEQKEETWVVKEKEGYPADFGKIKEMLLAIANLKVFEKKTSKPENYAKLGVEDPEGEESHSTLITLSDSSESVVASTIIGNQRMAKSPDAQDALYVRKQGDPQVWLVYGTVSSRSEYKDWVQKEIIDVNKDRIQSVLIKQADGSKLEAKKDKPEEKDFQLVDLPEGSEVQSVFALNQLAAVLEQLTFDDVRKRNDVEFDPEATVLSQYKTFDGLVINISSMEQDGKWHVKFNSRFDESSLNKQLEVVLEPEEQTETDTDQKETTIEAPVEVIKEAKAITDRVDKWVYIIPNFKARNITKKIADVIKEKG